MYFLRVLEAGSLKSRCHRGWILRETCCRCLCMACRWPYSPGCLCIIFTLWVSRGSNFLFFFKQKNLCLFIYLAAPVLVVACGLFSFVLACELLVVACSSSPTEDLTGAICTGNTVLTAGQREEHPAPHPNFPFYKDTSCIAQVRLL